MGKSFDTTKRVLKRYYENKDEMTNQQKICYKKSEDKMSQKQNDR